MDSLFSGGINGGNQNQQMRRRPMFGQPGGNTFGSQPIGRSPNVYGSNGPSNSMPQGMMNPTTGFGFGGNSGMGIADPNKQVSLAYDNGQSLPQQPSQQQGIAPNNDLLHQLLNKVSGVRF